MNIGRYIHTLWILRAEPHCFKRFAEGYWYTLLGVSAGAVVGSMVFGAYLFIVHPVRESAPGSLSARADILDPAQLEAVVETYVRRREAFQNSSFKGFADPSGVVGAARRR